METAQTNRAIVLRPSEIQSYDRGGGVTTTPLVTASMGSTSFINGITTFPPGAAIPFHSHNCEESVILLEGEAMLDIQSESFSVQLLDTTWIPANVPHRFRNLSNSHPMKIFWIYARADATRTLTETGETRFVSTEHTRK